MQLIYSGERLIGCLPVIDDGRLVGTVTDYEVFDELGPPVPLAHRPQARSPERPSVCPTARTRRRLRVTSACWEPTSARTTDAHSAKAGDRLGKFANSIERVSVRVKDVNGLAAASMRCVSGVTTADWRSSD